MSKNLSLKLNARNTRPLKRTAHGAHEMFQQIKAPGREHDNLNLIPEFHTVQGENNLDIVIICL